MQNPFPGIDPFVEAQGRWRDFHVTFMGAWREAIAAKLPDDYVVCLEEQMTIVEYEEDRGQRRSPDITIAQSVGSPRPEAGQLATIEMVELEPELTQILIEEEVRQSYIEILQLPDHRLVAVLELLSPTNKSGEGRSQYLAKRQQVALSEAHLVELDLLLDGKRLPFRKPKPNQHFYAMIARAGRRPDCELYSWSINQTMPKIPIPLAAPDPDIVVDLGPVLAVTYSRGRYDKLVNYEKPLDLPLAVEFQAWVTERLAAGHS